MYEKICIVMMSAAGDAVHTLPVVNALKRHRRQCHITWILQPAPATLVRGHPSVDELLLFDRSRGWQAFGDIRRTLASRAFDLVINLQVYFKAGVVTSFVKAPVKLGFDRARARDFNWLFTNRKIPPHPNQHVQDQYFEFLRAPRACRMASRSVARRASLAARILRDVRKTRGAHRRRHEQAGEGLVPGALGRGRGRTLARFRPGAGARWWTQPP